MLYPAKDTKIVTLDELRDTYRVPTVEELREMRGATADSGMGNRWKPIHHAELIEEIKGAVVRRGMRVTESQFQIDQETGHDMFGWLRVNREFEIPGVRIQHEIGFKSSNRQKFALLGVVAANVFVCSNGMITGEFVFGQKHTNKAEYAIGIDQGVETWCGKQDALERRVQSWHRMDIDEARYNRMLVECVRQDVFPGSQLMSVDDEWRIPRHAEFTPRNAFSFYNCVNESAKRWPISRQEKALRGCSELFDREFAFREN